MDNTAKSLYDIIAEAYKDGALPRDFSLPEEENSNGLCFADGAKDGIALYHMGAPEITDEIRAGIKNAVDAASNRDIEHAEELFRSLSEKISAIRAIDELQSFIIDNRDSLNAPDLYDCAARLMVNSSNRECVKFGMSILELFNIEDNKTLANAVEQIGHCNEFTIFSVFIMSRWNDGNEHIFHLAQNVHGWGRIHAIEHLEPETDEIKSWLLREGVNNEVLPAYSAIPCWEKSGAAELLHNPNLSNEDFKAILNLIDALLDEGPCAGISAIENSEELVVALLNLSKTHKLSVREYEIIRNIRIHFEEDNSEITALCNEILSSAECRQCVEAAIKEGKAIPIAKELGIDFKDDVLHLLEMDFSKHYMLCEYVMDDSYRARTIDIFRDKLPFDRLLEAEYGAPLIGNDFQIHNQLNIIVQELKDYPLEGTDLIEFCLKCGPVRDRYIAMRTLQNWVNLRQTPLETLLPETFYIVQGKLRIEPDDKIREKMENLIAGKIDDE